MAISRGAGTEIIRSIHMEDVSDTESILIYGVQHHIYTVLSVICFANSLNADTDYIQLRIVGYDSFAGTSAQNHYIFRQDMSATKTFVWNDRFSFNGHEPTDFSGIMDSVVKQDAIADQGSSVANLLKFNAEHSGDRIDVVCTYIDQNNA